MSKNPILNAFGAVGYIAIVVSVINLISVKNSNKPDTAFAPVVFLSLLTLSVVMMAFLFFYQPLQLFINDKKKEAVDLLIKTVSVFAIFTIVVVAMLFAGII